MADLENTVKQVVVDNKPDHAASVEPCEIALESLDQEISITELRQELDGDVLSAVNADGLQGVDVIKDTVEVQVQDGAKPDELKLAEQPEDEVSTPPQEELTSVVEEILEAVKIEPASGEESVDATKLAAIEPAAGQAGAGAPSARGYGFQSEFSAQNVASIAAVGALGETELKYDISTIEDTVFPDLDSTLPNLKPSFVLGDYNVSEDGNITLVASVSPESSQSTTVITISNIPAGWGVSDDAFDALGAQIGVGAFDAVTGTWTITLSGISNFNGGPIFTPPADSDVDALALEYSVIERNTVTGQTGSAIESFDIIVDAVADAPQIDALDDSGVEGVTLAIDVSALTGEAVHHGGSGDDGSEHIVSYEISGVPAGFVLSAGIETAPNSGVYTLTPAEIVGLTITPPNSNFFGTLNLTATVFTVDTPTDLEVDLTNNDNQASDSFALTWTPVINPPSVQVNGGVDNVYVKEDGSVDVVIEAQLGVNAASGEYLTVTVTGIDPSWGFNAPVGTYISVSGAWIVTLPAGQNLSTVLSFTPPADSDIDLTGLKANVIATDPASGLTANATPDFFNILVDAVADAPNLDAQNASGDEGTVIALDIITSVHDTDGSEVIEVVKISGIPAGATLTAGVYDAAHDVWSVKPSDLVGLGVSVPKGVTGTFDLTIESVAFEKNTNGSETDISDNRSSAFDLVKLIVDFDDVPVSKDVTVTIDETALAPAASVSGMVVADFGGDAPGHFNGNGTYFIGNLTSGGSPVSVSFDAVTNTYKGAASGAPIFTLVINDNGQYTFTLQGTLDHPDGHSPNDSLPLQFGVTAVDNDGDKANSIITVNVLDDAPVAHNDFASLNASDVSVAGSVIANDDLSKDLDNTITKISFGAHSVDIPTDGTYVAIDGKFGTLHINNSGEYTYDVSGSTSFGGLSAASLNPTEHDVAGLQNSITRNGITVSVANAGNFDLAWVVTADGNGIGIDNLDTNDSKKVWPKGETLDVSFDNNADVVTLTIAELGGNNSRGGYGIDYVVTLADGTQVAGEQEFVPTEIVDGVFSFDLNSSAFGGQLIKGVELVSTDAGSYLGASWLLNNVDVRYPHIACVQDDFKYTLADGDHDTSMAVLTVKTFAPENIFVVGQNADDTVGSNVHHLVGGDKGVINGGAGDDVLVGDAGGSFLELQSQDYNMVFILDVSGSMGSASSSTSKITLLKNAVHNLLSDVSTYDGGEVKVHIVPFSTSAKPAGTFTVTNAAEFALLETYLDGLTGNGLTNYEDPMQQAISWLQSAEPLGGKAITTTYFVSDGEPNRYIDAHGNVATGTKFEVMGEVTGADGSNEVAMLHALSDKVIGVGVDIGANIVNIDTIDSDGHALNIDNPSDLFAVLADTSPIERVLAVGGDEINGGDGNDIIFGDVLFTDDLATLHGLTVNEGAGWEVFERLEAGQSSVNTGWSRADTLGYIQSHAVALSEESLTSKGDARHGGDDIIHGGRGDDLIFGQEGDDVIYGGEGRDVIYGGSGADMFVFDSLHTGIDTIKDFNGGEGDRIDLSSVLAGFDPLTDNVSDFVIETESNGNTLLSVDQSGHAGVSGVVDLVVLENVTGFDLDAMLKVAA